MGLAGLDLAKHSTHSAKHRGATEAVAAGCASVEVTALGRWNVSDTGVRYVHDGKSFRKKLLDRFAT
jgi:hypothetical protein